MVEKLKVGIIGARVSGSRLAWLLAEGGLSVRLFEHRQNHEKACGGGMPWKAWNRLPALIESEVQACRISRMELLDGSHDSPIGIKLAPPLLIYSRSELDGWLRGRAVECGAELVGEKVEDIARRSSGWRVTTRRCEYECDYLVGADGVRSLLKGRYARPFAPADLSLALGYYLPGRFHPDTVVCRFYPPPLRGYLWSFPRHDHLSVGIIDRLDRADPRWMKAQVEDHIRRHYPNTDLSRAQEYAAPVPALGRRSLARNQVQGEAWAAVGDAAGFADPITGEGIYYALRSADLLSECLISGRPERYTRRCAEVLLPELRRAARWKEAFYLGIAGVGPAAGFWLTVAALRPAGYWRPSLVCCWNGPRDGRALPSGEMGTWTAARQSNGPFVEHGRGVQFQLNPWMPT